MHLLVATHNTIILRRKLLKYFGIDVIVEFLRRNYAGAFAYDIITLTPIKQLQKFCLWVIVNKVQKDKGGDDFEADYKISWRKAKGNP